MGIDAGGLAQEWFQLVSEEIFDPDMGLWQSSPSNQMSMQINPASGEYSGCLIAVPGGHEYPLLAGKTHLASLLMQNSVARITWCITDSWGVSWERPSLIDS
jgi:hypothetical protein